VAAASKIRVVIQTASLRQVRREVLLFLGAASGTTYSCIPAGLVASYFMLLIRHLRTVLLAHTPYLKLACRTPSVGAGTSTLPGRRSYSTPGLSACTVHRYSGMYLEAGLQNSFCRSWYIQTSCFCGECLLLTAVV
jgi:hypothetical protein